MGLAKLCITTTLALALSACAADRTSQIRNRAPQSATEVGVLVEGAEEKDIDTFLAKNQAAQIRRLSSQSHFVEIFGVSEETIRESLKAKHIEKNEFLDRETLVSQSKAEDKWATAGSMPPPAGIKVGALKACKTEAQYPEAVLSIAQPAKADVEQIITMELGGSIEVNGTESKAHSLFPSELKSVIMIIPPAASRLTPGPRDLNTFKFQPDALGLYRVILLVQDSRDACAAEQARFIVTANRAYSGTSKPTGRLPLERMLHLNEVRAQESWKTSEGAGMTIAVVDTGVNYNHPSLSGQLAIDPDEIPGNGKDDDGNGLVDDAFGYDFVNGDGMAYDDDGHGTHVAGLAVAKDFGMARKAKLLPIKALGSLGGDIGTVAFAIGYAVDQGANIINLSLGGPSPQPHPAIVRALKYAELKGVLVVAATGNGDPMSGLGLDIDILPVYPASLPNGNLLTVAASDSINALAPYSNFGAKSADVVAPGGAPTENLIYSASFENPYNALFNGLHGTSMAAPISSGIAAQVWSLNPRLTAVEVKNILISAGKEIASLKPITVSGRHLDAVSALEIVNPSHVLF